MNLTITDDMTIKYVTGGIEYTLDKMIFSENGNEHVVYEPQVGPDYSTMYFTIEALEAGIIKFNKGKNAPSNTFYYSTDNGSTWTSANSTTSWNIPVAGGKVLLKATANQWATSANSGYHWFFNGTAAHKVYGNIMSLLYGDNFIGQTTLPNYNFIFENLFAEFNYYTNPYVKDISNLILPATTLHNNCYQYMFAGCNKIVSAPELPATTLANNCYGGMFRSCTSLTTAPALPATTLADYCYNSMFNSCTSLTTAPELPATTLAGGCYDSMFYGCTSLTTAPTLPATTLATSCYNSMFRQCSSLVNAPALSVTTLANSCYGYMFYGCTSLTTAPALPATTLKDNCYMQMFYNCTSLTTAPELPATATTANCYSQMFQNCSSLNYIKCLATSKASGAFSSWVNGVAATGTFVKNPSATFWITGDTSGIPSGWTVEDAA